LNLKQEADIVSENMIMYGGKFVQRLGHAIIAADNDNLGRIKETWPKYWFEYLNFKD